MSDSWSEGRTAADSWSEEPAIPGGWTDREFHVGQRTLKLRMPADPDRFLDDPAVHAANKVNDYMPYWSFLWPAAVPTTAALQHAPWPVGTRVLELGCGLGLVGLAGLARGDDVVFSDYDNTSLESVRRNAVLNGFPVPETWFLDWSQPRPEQFAAIVGCEVTYEAKLHPVLLGCLQAMLAPEGVCWLSDPGRFQGPHFVALARQRGFQVRILNERGEVQPGTSVQKFQIFELRHGSR